MWDEDEIAKKERLADGRNEIWGSVWRTELREKRVERERSRVRFESESRPERQY